MTLEKIAKLSMAISVAAFAVSLYAFSRVTVDDAFISWRYGKNLVDFGIWGFNPTDYDLTQAYTNPLFAFLSIVPAALSLDFVLFFKFISIVCVCFFCWLLIFKVDKTSITIIPILLFLASPNTVIHAFAGLETFAYVALLGFGLIGIDQGKHALTSVLIVMLILCRPEAWLWTALLPVAALCRNIQMSDLTVGNGFTNNLLSHLRDHWRTITYTLLPGISLLCLLGFHKYHFNYFLPNTFYIKSVAGASFRIGSFFFYLLCLIPLTVPLLSGRRFVPFLAFTYYLPVAYNYSNSSLQMDYSGRFAFQIFAPVFIYAYYTVGNEVRIFQLIDLHKKSPIATFKLSSVFAVFLSVTILLFTYKTNSERQLLGIANYYPRLLNGHTALGNALRSSAGEGNKIRLVIGDAGVVPFHSNGIALDYVGLGSSKIAHDGLSVDLLNEYDPEHVFLYANSLNGVRSNYNASTILEWMKERKMNEEGDLYFTNDSFFRCYSTTPNCLIAEACETSKNSNNISQWEFFVQNIRTPPWIYWHE